MFVYGMASYPTQNQNGIKIIAIYSYAVKYHDIDSK